MVPPLEESDTGRSSEFSLAENRRKTKRGFSSLHGELVLEIMEMRCFPHLVKFELLSRLLYYLRDTIEPLIPFFGCSV